MSRFTPCVRVSTVLFAVSMALIGCSDRSLTVFPGMSLGEVRERSSGFDDELTFDNSAAGIPSELAQNEYERITVARGEAVQLTVEQPEFLRVFVQDGVVVELLVRPFTVTALDELFPAARQTVESLLALGWREVDPDRPVTARIHPEVFAERPGDSDPFYRHAGALVDDDGVIAAFDLKWYEQGGLAWLDIRFELPREDDGTFVVPTSP